MSLDNALKSSKVTFDRLSYFSLLESLPFPVIIRNSDSQPIYVSKMARDNSYLSASGMFIEKAVQAQILEKSTILFQQKKIKSSHSFEVAVKEYYLSVCQTLEQTPDGAIVIVELIKDITKEKANAIALNLMSNGLQAESDENSLDLLTHKLAEEFELDLVMIAITDPSERKNTALSCWLRGTHIADVQYDLKETPCGRIHDLIQPLLIPCEAQALFPGDPFFKEHNLHAFYGMPLVNSKGAAIGIFTVANKKAFTNFALLEKVLEILNSKLALEVNARKHIQGLELQEAWIRQAINSYKDPICIFDNDYKLRDFNDAYAQACKKEYNVTVQKGIYILDEVQKNVLAKKNNNTITISQLKKRKDWLIRAFNGEHHTTYVDLKRKNEGSTHYSFSYHPIYNREKTEVNEVLLITHNTTSLIKSKKALEKLRKHYYSIFENSLMGIGVYDTINNKWIDCNEQLLDLFGIKSKEEGMKYQPGVLSPELQPNGMTTMEMKKIVAETFKNNEKFNVSWTHKKLDGTEFPSDTSFIPLNDEQPGLFCIAIRDMSEQMAHQSILEQKNRELELYIKSNSQLENLAYSACHDLKEPLRTIGTFTQILKKKHKDTIDDKSKEYMDFIVNGVTRMNNFVDGLFTYSLVRENKTDFEEFSLKKLLEFILMDLNQSIEEKNAVVKFQTIPENITGNLIKIKQLFQNLIANALKFQQPLLMPIIIIKGSETDTHWQFSVTDNGIGIAEEYHDQVFTLFRKLHSKDQYEGSGIGLALCKEIAEQHNGTISVSSEMGVGTTFSFEIAKDLNKSNSSSPFAI